MASANSKRSARMFMTGKGNVVSEILGPQIAGEAVSLAKPFGVGFLRDANSVSYSHTNDPIPLFQTWLQEAAASGLEEPTAMTVATVDPDGYPDARLLLLFSVGGGRDESDDLFRPRQSATSAVLVWIPRRAGADRILEAKAIPASRTDSLHARSRRLADAVALSVASAVILSTKDRNACTPSGYERGCCAM